RAGDGAEAPALPRAARRPAPPSPAAGRAASRRDPALQLDRPDRGRRGAHRRGAAPTDRLGGPMSNVVSTPGGYDAKQIEDAKVMCALGYFPVCGLPTFLVPMFGAKENRYAQFHARQAAVLYLSGFAA